MKPKILILCCWWKRADVTELHLQSIDKCKQEVKFVDIEYLAVISPEDPEFFALTDLARKHKCRIILYKNLPIGEKHNAGVNSALTFSDFNYLMNIGSDDCIFPELFLAYKDKIKLETPFFGIINFYMRDFKNQKEKYFFDRSKIESQFAIGGGRMIHRSILERLSEKSKNLYENKKNKGLDGSSGMTVRDMGYKMELIDNGKIKMIEAFKVDTAITHFEFLKLNKCAIKL